MQQGTCKRDLEQLFGYTDEVFSRGYGYAKDYWTEEELEEEW